MSIVKKKRLIFSFHAAKVGINLQTCKFMNVEFIMYNHPWAGSEQMNAELRKYVKKITLYLLRRRFGTYSEDVRNFKVRRLES